MVFAFPLRTFTSVALIAALAFALTSGNDLHNIKKRQIGVLARTGALPQGKRSVEVLARDGELPMRGNTRKEKSNDQILDLLIRELATAEDLSRLRVQALSRRFLDEIGSEKENFYEFGKRSVAALARNGELPQKRLTEIASRSGYLVKPAKETVQQQPDILNPDDFLADGHSSQTSGYLDKRNVGAAKNFLLENPKRTLASAKNFLFSKNKEPDFERNLMYKRSFRNHRAAFGFPAYLWLKDPDAFDYYDVHVDAKKNVGASKNFGKRADFQEPDISFKEEPQQNLELKAEENGNRKKRETDFESSQDEIAMPYFQDLKEFEGEDYPAGALEGENVVEKRFLGVLSPWAEKGEFFVGKRHIGALARLGWLPSYPNARYSRSGRAARDRTLLYREDSTVGPNPSKS